MKQRQFYWIPILLWGLLGLGTSGIAYAEPIDHFKGEPANSLEQALENLAEYNQKLEATLSERELNATSLGNIHQYTYTLENALGKIHEELRQLADTLEEVHIASETNDTETVLTKSREYLSVSRQAIRH
ncbi:DUF6746 family protein [Thiohalomonas denitrificans]|uniref:Uncharacterized protein n=1 Tax=Thiohalomonas denitrificans TaxID=415747 RepID=A0A1G5QUW7_9GAMM|nr:DUF6746 family protein [Thiohalomonas denitrificans]SCZ65547.1 hypothetical protein SAMN03097708_02837 [Thiohalomonas denitrificans]